MKNRALLYLLFVVVLSACQDRPPDGGVAAPPEPVLDSEGYTQLDDDDIPIDPPGVVVDDGPKVALGAPKPDGNLYGEEIDELPAEFRAATWNVRQLTVGTTNNQISLKPKGTAAPVATPKGEAVLKALRLYGIHVAALQEVYRPKNGGAFPLPNAGEGYTIIRGEEIKTNPSSHDNFWFEHCPIAYREAKFDCADAGVDPAAQVHWVSCTIKNTTKTFYFGCGHFSTKVAFLEDNLKAFFERLDATPAQHPSVGNSAATQDNFIVGLDANSNPSGYQQTKWNDWHSQWQQRNGGNTNAIKFMPVGPPGTATKIYKVGNKIRITSTAGKKIIDFLFWSFGSGAGITYRPNSLQALNVRLLNTALTGQAFWNEYYRLSDHIPVKADYTY